jgi:outer membrane lipoprotein-sorting protein
MHQWVDVGAMLSGIPAGARRAGLGGLGLFADAVSERSSVVHKVSTVRIAGPNRYRVDHADPSRDVAKTIVCDGQRRWQVYDDKVMVSATAQTPGDVADLADASWLLECGLTGGELVMVGDRPGYRVGVARGDALWSMALMFGQAMAVVDAELGVLLRLTCYLRGKPVQRMELRDLTAGAGDFPVDIPPDLPVVEETRAAPYGGNVPLNIAGAVAKETAKEARNFLNSFNRGRR